MRFPVYTIFLASLALGSVAQLEEEGFDTRDSESLILDSREVLEDIGSRAQILRDAPALSARRLEDLEDRLLALEEEAGLDPRGVYFCIKCHGKFSSRLARLEREYGHRPEHWARIQLPFRDSDEQLVKHPGSAAHYDGIRSLLTRLSWRERQDRGNHAHWRGTAGRIMAGTLFVLDHHHDIGLTHLLNSARAHITCDPLETTRVSRVRDMEQDIDVMTLDG
ncbi:hypothetical protein NMY22_g10916 [Coprinellus aureogranulatus]|nr:hypothetical protein NMY22_g10916 [Coprinellus aureogranulatus]